MGEGDSNRLLTEKEGRNSSAQVKGYTLAELSAATCATAEKFFPKL